MGETFHNLVSDCGGESSSIFFIVCCGIYKSMLRNPDGSCYRTVGSLAQFDPENQDHFLFNAWDQESIQIGGSPIFYHEVYIQSGTVDQQYMEDRGKIFSPVGIQLWGFYEPVSSQNYQGAFGFDAPDEVNFEFNYRAVLKTIGHPPKIGSRLFTPHKREDWVVVTRKVGEFKMWGELRLVLGCQRFQEDVITGEGRVTQKKPDFKIN